MSAPMIIAVAAFVAVCAAVALVSMLTQRRSDAVLRRLDDHAVAVARVAAKRRERINVLKDRADASLLGRFRPSETATVELERAGSTMSVARYLLLRLALAVILFVAVAVGFGNALLGLPVAIVAAMLPRVVLMRKAKRRLLAYEAQLAEAIDLLVGALRAGHGFLQGLESVAKQMEDPTRHEINRVLEEVNVGINPVDALEGVRERIPSYDLALLVSAISVQRQTGGNLAEVLENLAATVRERRRVRGEVQALTTGPRVSSYVLGAIPVLLFLYFIAISTDYRDIMLGTTYGHILLGLAAVLSTLGYVFSRKVSKVEY
jgi:tight adherence protein B